MKFWELISAFREFESEVAATLASPKWKQSFGDWNSERGSLVQKLDSELPDALVQEVVSAVGDKLSLYLEDGWLRRRPLSAHAQRLSLLEVMTQHGGAVLEEVLEYGSAQIKTLQAAGSDSQRRSAVARGTAAAFGRSERVFELAGDAAEFDSPL